MQASNSKYTMLTSGNTTPVSSYLLPQQPQPQQHITYLPQGYPTTQSTQLFAGGPQTTTYGPTIYSQQQPAYGTTSVYTSSGAPVYQQQPTTSYVQSSPQQPGYYSFAGAGATSHPQMTTTTQMPAGTTTTTTSYQMPTTTYSIPANGASPSRRCYAAGASGAASVVQQQQQQPQQQQTTTTTTTVQSAAAQRYQPADAAAVPSFSYGIPTPYNPQYVPAFEAPVQVNIPAERYRNWWAEATSSERTYLR